MYFGPLAWSGEVCPHAMRRPASTYGKSTHAACNEFLARPSSPALEPEGGGASWVCIRMFFAHFFWFASVWARIGRASQLPWRRSATCKRRPNKGGPCHAAPTAENHATGGSVSQIKAEPVTLQLPPRRSATCKRRPNKGGPCHVAPTVEKTRREHKSGTSRPSQAERTTAPRQRPTAPRQRPDSAQTAPRGDRVIFGENI